MNLIYTQANGYASYSGKTTLDFPELMAIDQYVELLHAQGYEHQWEYKQGDEFQGDHSYNEGSMTEQEIVAAALRAAQASSARLNVGRRPRKHYIVAVPNMTELLALAAEVERLRGVEKSIRAMVTSWREVVRELRASAEQWRLMGKEFAPNAISRDSDADIIEVQATILASLLPSDEREPPA